LIPSFQSKYVLHIAKMRKLNLISKSKVVDELIRRRLIARHLRSLTLNTAKPSEYSRSRSFLLEYYSWTLITTRVMSSYCGASAAKVSAAFRMRSITC